MGIQILILGFKGLIIYRVRAVFGLPMTRGTQLLYLGDYKILGLSYKSYAEHPRFYRFRALGSLQFILEHSLESMKIYNPLSRTANQGHIFPVSRQNVRTCVLCCILAIDKEMQVYSVQVVLKVCCSGFKVVF